MSIPFLITYDLAMRIRQKKVKSEIRFWSLWAKMNQNMKLKYILWAKVGKLILVEKTPNHFTDKSFCPFASSKDLFRNGQNTSPNLILWNFNLGRPQEHPLDFMEPVLLQSKNFNINGGSKIFFRQLEFGHWVAQTLPFFDKLRILASYNNLKIRHNFEFAKFWARALKV